MDNKLIARVRKMEDDFNMVRDIMDDMEMAVYNFEAVQRRIERLFQYMEDGQFLKDFEADERGELPKDMERGVLSEDALDQLLVDVTMMRNRLKELVADVKPKKDEEIIGFEEFDPLYNEPGEIPDDSGSYIVVAREEGEGFPYLSEEPEEFEGQDVLYVGEAENLRKVADIFKGNSAQSALRLNIGALHCLNPVKTKDGIRFSAEEERWLSKWMNENILFYYQVNPQHEEVTRLLADELDPVLNLGHASPAWEELRKRLDVLRNNCIEDADYEKVNTKKTVIRVPKKGMDLETAIRMAVEDNASRIPEKFGVATVETLIYFTGHEEDGALAMLFGAVNEYGEKEQSVTFWSDDFAGENGIRKFLKSPEGKFFKGDEDSEDFQLVTKAGNPKLPALIVAVMKKFLEIDEETKLSITTSAQTYKK